MAAMKMEVMVVVEVVVEALQEALLRPAASTAAMETVVATVKASLLVPASGLDHSLLVSHKLKVLRIREALLTRISRTDN
ncbi:unnamed protein product [Timema podura]|uniref:Uncharacterized protein n=1 Tax=Timema podura TaxID=61482 RepID=A0ABN7PC49_TIMPD|nr:unnamed protein product [Timema podura]